MAHESFEDPETAALLNEHVVAVKVDREERPDVDAVYMTATQAMTGQGGWPMTVFMTPDQEPFFCGTYYPRDYFRQLVLNVSQAWRSQRDDVTGQAKHVAAALAENAAATARALRDAGTADPDAAPFRQAAETAVAGARPRLRRRPTAGSAARRSSRRRWCWNSCSATTSGPDRRPRCGWPRAPARRWPAAACTTSSAAGSPGTRSTPAGWSRTSRRCSTTTPCWPASTLNLWRRTGSGLARRVAEETCAWMLRELRTGERRASPPRWTPTARAKRESSTSGAPPSCSAVLGPAGRRVRGRRCSA